MVHIVLVTVIAIYYFNSILVLLRILTDHALYSYSRKNGQKLIFKWFFIPFSALW